MSANFYVSSLPAYVQEKNDVLVKNFALVGGGTRSHMTIQTGIKYKEHLNYLNLAPTLQDGKSCGFEASGSATLSYKEIECPTIKVNMDICEKSVLGKFAEHQLALEAGMENLPFEEYVLKALTDEISKKIEKLIWQGDKSQTTNTDIKWIDGILTQAAADSDVIDVTLTSITGNYNKILAVYNAMPEETLDRGGEIYVSPAIYRGFLQDILALNLFHYPSAGEEFTEEFYLPGTDVKVIRTQGLAGKSNIVGTFKGNLVYGCDIEGASETIDMWFSKDDQVFKFNAVWNTGVSYFFGNQVVLGA